METEDAVVLLVAAPATAYREYLYRPRGQLARWMDNWFDVLATPGQRPRRAVREGDVLLEVTLGRSGPGRCTILAADQSELDLSRSGLPPGRLLLRPRRQAQLSEPLRVEPTGAEPDGDARDAHQDKRIAGPAADTPPREHDMIDEAGEGALEAVDASAGVPPDAAEGGRPAEPLAASVSANSETWGDRIRAGA